MQERENYERFFSGAKSLGLTATDLFAINDLYEGENAILN